MPEHPAAFFSDSYVKQQHSAGTSILPVPFQLHAITESGTSAGQLLYSKTLSDLVHLYDGLNRLWSERLFLTEPGGDEFTGEYEIRYELTDTDYLYIRL